MATSGGTSRSSTRALARATFRLINRFIELGKPFEMMEYPNRTHAIAEGPGTTVHIYRTIARYFLEHLH